MLPATGSPIMQKMTQVAGKEYEVGNVRAKTALITVEQTR